MCRCEDLSNHGIKISLGTPEGHEIARARVVEICVLSGSRRAATRHESNALVAYCQSTNLESSIAAFMDPGLRIEEASIYLK